MNKTQLKKALFNALRKKEGYSVERSKWIVDHSVWTKDPYGWASNADWTISTEDGIPSYDMGYFWNSIREQFKDVVFQPCNGAIMAVYKD